MRHILEEVIMSDRHISDGEMYPFLQLFSILKKNRLNRKLDSTVLITHFLYSLSYHFDK